MQMSPSVGEKKSRAVFNTFLEMLTSSFNFSVTEKYEVLLMGIFVVDNSVAM